MGGCQAEHLRFYSSILGHLELLWGSLLSSPPVAPTSRRIIAKEGKPEPLLLFAFQLLVEASLVVFFIDALPYG